MKRVTVVCVALALVLGVGISSVFAGTLPNNGKLSGPHWQFNIIGHPNNKFGGDYSGGHTVMVPLKTVNGPTEMVCNVDGVKLVDDQAPTWKTSVMGGVRIVWEVSNQVANFTIVDRDALDGQAKILVPESMVDAAGNIKFDIYIRALGKPNTCMNINAYAYDADQSLYFWAGSVYISRKTGKSVFTKANELFDVNFCQVDTMTNTCVEGTTTELSVFSDVFEEYFWQILNDGSRNVQVRIYPQVANNK